MKTTANLAASVRQRLLNHAKAKNRPFDETLRAYAMERFLFRLGQSRHGDRFVLKGALMLVVWDAPLRRSTMDIDLLGSGPHAPAAMEKTIRDVCAVPSEDGLIFDLESVAAAPIRAQTEYAGVRILFRAFLDRARIPMQVDVGFGDLVTPAPRRITYPVLLQSEAPSVRAYNRETVIAEKFEAMVKLGEQNSRMKDFLDIWLLSQQFEFDGALLQKACHRTFRHRETPIEDIPVALTVGFGDHPEKKRQWNAYLRRLGLDFKPPVYADVIATIRTFLLPLVVPIQSNKPFHYHWTPPAGSWCPAPARAGDLATRRQRDGVMPGE